MKQNAMKAAFAKEERILVHCDNADFEKRAKRILEKAGAQDVSASGEARADFGATDQAEPRSKALSPSESTNK